MSVEHVSDEELVLRSREASGAQAAEYINEVFHRHYSQVARWCLRFANDRESAADLAQEVFARAYQNLQSFQGNAKFTTWLFTIARNHCLNVIRANARQATELRTEVDDRFFDQLPAPEENYHATVERESTEKLVRDLMDEALDETEKSVFTLHYGEGLPLDVISRALNLNNSSGSKAYIVSAKRKLAKAVQRWNARNKSSAGQRSGV
jgi:RNA polymerase sigma-70 factor, ECF subfamily